jgi:hypothetical protein
MIAYVFKIVVTVPGQIRAQFFWHPFRCSQRALQDSSEHQERHRSDFSTSNLVGYWWSFFVIKVLKMIGHRIIFIDREVSVVLEQTKLRCVYGFFASFIYLQELGMLVSKSELDCAEISDVHPLQFAITASKLIDADPDLFFGSFQDAKKIS